MRYSVETVTQSSQHEMLNFLKEHENYTLFLLGNFENYGATLTDAPYSGNFKLIRSQDQVVGVFCLTRKGNLLIICHCIKEYKDLGYHCFAVRSDEFNSKNSSYRYLWINRTR
jgi:hypothetical protein